jgi:hypothetical protein
MFENLCYCFRYIFQPYTTREPITFVKFEYIHDDYPLYNDVEMEDWFNNQCK